MALMIRNPAHGRRAHGFSMNKKRLVTLLWLTCLLPGSALAQAFSPHKVFGRYQQFVWQEQQGLPQNTVQAITRTRDGYLWLGTQAGVARFDGAGFTVFDSSNTGEIKGSLITALLEDRAGDLWLGTDGSGLNLYRAGRFRLYTTGDGLPDDHVRALLEDRAGNLWVGTYGGVALFKDGHFTVYSTRDGLPNDTVEALAEDPDGGLWVGTRGGLALFKDGRFTTYTAPGGLTHNLVRTLNWDRAGLLWMATDGGLKRFDRGRFTTDGLQPELARALVQSIYQDREGSVWFGTSNAGLFRLSEGRFSRYSAVNGLPGDRVAAIYQDPEGDLWFGTNGGLSQLKHGRFQVYTAQDGLADDFVWAIYEDASGSVWMSTNKGLNRFKDGKFTVYTMKDGLPSRYVPAICEDAAGNLWLGTGGHGVIRFKDGRFTTWTTKDGLSSDNVSAVHEDRAGNLWVATYGGGVNLFRDGRFTVYTTRDGLASDYVRVIYEDRAGNIWFGTRNGGVSRFRDGRFTTWTTKEGTSNFVMAMYEDPGGALWVSTLDEGLSRFKDGKFVTVTARDGLFDNVAFQILPDADDGGGDLWMSCNRGIYRVSLKELNDFADGRARSVTSFAYGVADGMLNPECNASSPAGWKTRDGRLWFPTIKGAVVIDSRKQSLQPPLLAIEQVTLDRLPLPISEAVEINPGQGNLEIQYTGLSWGRPQQIRFKYRLVGLDDDWVEAGSRRTAYYTHLPPGSYTFKVIADNGEGIWNTEGKSLRVTVLPAFYRTWWFMTLSALLTLGLVAYAYQLRVRQLKRARAAQEEFSRQLIASQELERKRIAAELHDSLGQSLIVIKNLAVMMLYPSDQEIMRQQAQEISSETSRAIGEVKEISYNLRPFHLDQFGLTRSIESLIDNVAKACDIKISADLDHIDGLFAKDEEINLYRIVQEGLNNVVKHSAATAASVLIRQGEQSLTVTIKDNGRGFTALTQAAPSQESGFGLTGIAERARLLGGEAHVQGEPGRGTTVSININLKGKPHER